MKRIVIALLATAAALAANSARADTRFSIGVNVGAPVYREVPPPVRSIRALIGMWQAAHSSWMAAACAG